MNYSGPAPVQQSTILEEFVRNTGADRNFAIKILQDNKWDIKHAYKEIEKLCISSGKSTGPHTRHSAAIPIHTVPGGSPVPPSSSLGYHADKRMLASSDAQFGVGTVSAASNVSSPRPDRGYDSPVSGRKNETMARFPVRSSPDGTPPFPQSVIQPSSPQPREIIIPIQVERGSPARSLMQPTTVHLPPPHPQPRVMMEERRASPTPQITPQFIPHSIARQPLPQSEPPQGSRESSPAKTVPSSTLPKSEAYPKLRRGISNIMENTGLVSEARNSVLHDIQEDSHDHMYVQTFVLPNLTMYPEDFRAFLEKELIETSTLVSLEQAGRLNWWAELRICQRLLPMATTGDGNCLLHAASLAMWGMHDRQLILRSALYDLLTQAPYRDNLYRRWRWQQTQLNKQSGLVFSEEEWTQEWDNVLRLASPKPRLAPESSRPSSCCDSPITQGSSVDPITYESLEEFHVFVLAHVLQRPIIIVADTVLKDASGEALAPIPFGGIYLPLECLSKICYRSPLLLTYDAAHFSALVPMELDMMPGERPLPAAIPLVDPSQELLPLHFSVDPGSKYDWSKGGSSPKMHPSTEDRLNLLKQYLDVEKLMVPQFDADNDSDRQSCGSYESDDSISCVGNKEKKKEARVSQQMQSVAKQFGSIGKSMGKKLKKNFGNIGKGKKGNNDYDKSGERRPSVGSAVTQSTKVIASIAACAERSFIWCARLSTQRTDAQKQMIDNYLRSAQERFEKDRDLKRQKGDELRSKVSVYPANSSGATVKCVTPSCPLFGTAETSYMCTKCYQKHKQDELEVQRQSKIGYHTFPGRRKSAEVDGVLKGDAYKYGKSKFYTTSDMRGGGDMTATTVPVSNPTRENLLPKQVNDVALRRSPTPDYDNIDYGEFKKPYPPGDGPVVRKANSMAIGGPSVKCPTEGCEFFGSRETDNLCSACYKKKRNTLLAQTNPHTTVL